MLISWKEVKTVPNLLSLSRAIAIVPFYFFITNGYLTDTLVVFLLASATDAVDGWYAKKYKQITTVGKALDPAADKIFFLTVSFLLVPRELLGWWGALFALEGQLFAMGTWAFLRQKQGKFKLGANLGGKIKVWAEVGVIAFLFANKLGVPIKIYSLKIAFTIAIVLATLSLIGHLRLRKNK